MAVEVGKQPMHSSASETSPDRHAWFSMPIEMEDASFNFPFLRHEFRACVCVCAHAGGTSGIMPCLPEICCVHSQLAISAGL
jgi:hypothetical protein